MPPVIIQLISDDPSPVPIEEMVVEFYDTLAVFQTSGISDSDGEVEVTLPDGTYNILFFKIGVSILPRQPQQIIVDSLLINTFEVVGHIRETPESIDPIRCTVSGSIIGVGGGSAVHRLIFEPFRILTVLDNKVIAPYHRIEFTSDDSGYFKFELLRNTKYNAYFLWPQDLFRQQPGRLDVITPDLPAMALDSLLFPLPLTFTFSVPTITLIAGAPLDNSIIVTATFTDGSVRTSLSTPWAGVTLINSDNKIVKEGLKDGVLSLQPLSPGTCTITTVREIPSSVLFSPMPEYTSGSVIVTVI